MKLIFVFGICDGGHVHPISVRSNGSSFFFRARLHEIHFSLSICSLSFARYSSRTNDIDTGLLYSEDYCLSALPLYRLRSSVHLLDWFCPLFVPSSSFSYIHLYFPFLWCGASFIVIARLMSFCCVSVCEWCTLVFVHVHFGYCCRCMRVRVLCLIHCCIENIEFWSCWSQIKLSIYSRRALTRDQTNWRIWRKIGFQWMDLKLNFFLWLFVFLLIYCSRRRRHHRGRRLCQLLIRLVSLLVTEWLF